MSDTPEMNVSALAAQICGCADRPQHIRDCALIRSYGDQRHAEGYAQAVADVVEWINSGAGPHVEGYGEEIATEIASRFGKGQDHG